MAYIQKRTHPNGSIKYRVRIRISGMPDQSATFTTRTQAKIWAQKMEAQIRHGRIFSKEHTFSDLVDRYIEKELPKRPKSLKKQTSQLLWWKKHLGSYYLSRITPSTIAELRDQLQSEVTYRKRLRTPSTANRYLAVLSQAFKTAIKEWGWLQENPLDKITRPRENKPRERYLDKNEIALLLSACKKCKRSPYLYPIVLFALATGARFGEIANLQWDDIDFHRSIATFRETKNGETRSVPLSPIVLTTLKQQFSQRLVPSPYVFSSRDGAKPADIRGAWTNVLQKLNLKDVCFHSLRHTAASQLAQRGASTLEIAAILGHKTLAMVKRYSHFSTSSTAQSLIRMNEEVLQSCMND